MATNQPVLFTGAEVSVISESTFNNSLNGQSLHQKAKTLCGPVDWFQNVRSPFCLSPRAGIHLFCFVITAQLCSACHLAR